MQSRTGLVPRACRHCRTRKIRCDRAIPCSNCKTARLRCSGSKLAPPTAYSPASAEPGHDDHSPETQETSYPVPSTLNDTCQGTDVVEKLNLISKQLGALNQHLEHPPRNPHVGGSGSQPTSPPTQTPGAYSSLSLAEGDISFQKQTMLAAEAASSGLGTLRSDRDLATTLACLQTVVQAQTTPNFATLSDVIRDHRHGRILPVEVASVLCQHANVNPPKVFLNYTLRSSSAFIRSCSKIYFGPHKTTMGEVAILHGLAYFCLTELKERDDTLFDREAYLLHLETSETVFTECLNSHWVLMQPLPDNILALVLGVLKAHANAQEELCEMLVGVAARHCLALGYNRAKTRDTIDRPTENDSDDRMKLFWMIYAFDKNISLKSGRPPHIPDNDVDIKFPAATTNPELRAWDEASLAYLRLAQIQGQIYNDLYCVSALRRSETDRQASIDTLASMLTQWKDDFSAIDKDGCCHRDHFDFAHGSSDVTVESLRTIVYRASTLGPKRFLVSADCLRAATDCLDAHICYISRYSDYKAGILDGYINGVLSWASLTPFAVVFMHAIVTRSPDEVALLQRATEAIASIESSSVTCKRLHKLCFAFTNFAAAVVLAEQPARAARTTQYQEAVEQQPLPQCINHVYPNQHQPNASYAVPSLRHQQAAHQIGGAFESDTCASTQYYDQPVHLMPDGFANWVDSNRPVFSFDYTSADVEEFQYPTDAWRSVLDNW